MRRWADVTTHRLVGVVTYYGKHYSTFFFHTKLQLWIYFDDASVSEVGPDWQHVVDKCRRGHFQPLLLLYADPNGTAVSTATAPTTVTLVGSKQPQTRNANPYGSLPPAQRRSLTPNPELMGGDGRHHAVQPRRAVTPSPDTSGGHLKRPQRCNAADFRDYQNITDLEGLYGQQPPDDVFESQPPASPNSDAIYIHRQTVESILRTQMGHVAGGSHSCSDLKIAMAPSANIPRCRDSGNWSGDRNSASSSSSTTMDNPYLYIMGRAQR